MPNPFTHPDEAMEALESGVSQATKRVQKHVGQVASDTTKQVRPTDQDIVHALYAPSEKPADQNASSEAGIEQASQGGGQQQQQQAQQKAESTKSNAEKYGTLADQIPVIPGQREADYKHSTGSLEDEIPLLPGFGDPVKTSSLGDQLTGQSDSKDIMKMAGVDPTKQMTSEDREKLDETQKQQREQMRQHNREYIRFGTPLDPIGSLEEQVAKVRKQKEEEEKRKLQEEEEEKKKKEEEKKKQEEQLQQPTTKPKPGSPNIAIGQAQKKTEVHRGAAG